MHEPNCSSWKTVTPRLKGEGGLYPTAPSAAGGALVCGAPRLEEIKKRGQRQSQGWSQGRSRGSTSAAAAGGRVDDPAPDDDDGGVVVQVQEGQLLSPGRCVGGAWAVQMRCRCGALAVPMRCVSCSLSSGSHFLRSTMITVSSMSRYWWGERVEIGRGWGERVGVQVGGGVAWQLAGYRAGWVSPAWGTGGKRDGLAWRAGGWRGGLMAGAVGRGEVRVDSVPHGRGVPHTQSKDPTADGVGDGVGNVRVDGDLDEVVHHEHRPWYAKRLLAPPHQPMQCEDDCEVHNRASQRHVPQVILEHVDQLGWWRWRL
eukprot:scaffold56189_cov50-Phaeocystis_antarctica.AAC.1